MAEGETATAKEAWKVLEEAYLGNESMRRNIFDALSNEAEGFYMLDNETHEEMYFRLKLLSCNRRKIFVFHATNPSVVSELCLCVDAR